MSHDEKHMKIYYFIFIMALALLMGACTNHDDKKNSANNGNEDFNIFIKAFFKDSSFQKSRVSFPFHERPSELESKARVPIELRDTVIKKSADEWEYIPEYGFDRGSRYTIYTDTMMEKQDSLSSSVREVFFSMHHFVNASLVFTTIDNKWYLIRMSYPEKIKSSNQ
jgi:hypothetical protein